MRAVVIYESMYGNMHLVAEAVAEGLRDGVGADLDAVVVAVADADGALAGAELVVVGGPTHVHSMSRESTRHAAVEAAGKEGSTLHLEDDAEGPGLREWFDRVETLPELGAAFDTRADAAPLVTGRASKGIAKRLRRHGCELVAEPESFVVTKENELVDDELAHARRWGAELAAATGERSNRRRR
jgi:hypothetical protein